MYCVDFYTPVINVGYVCDNYINTIQIFMNE
jgi:hypothetical protein